MRTQRYKIRATAPCRGYDSDPRRLLDLKLGDEPAGGVGRSLFEKWVVRDGCAVEIKAEPPPSAPEPPAPAVESSPVKPAAPNSPVKPAAPKRPSGRMVPKRRKAKPKAKGKLQGGR